MTLIKLSFYSIIKTEHFQWSPPDQQPLSYQTAKRPELLSASAGTVSLWLIPPLSQTSALPQLSHHTHTHLFPAALCLTSALADISIGVLGVAYSCTPLIAVKQGDGRRITVSIHQHCCLCTQYTHTVSHVNAAFVCSSHVYADDWGWFIAMACCKIGWTLSFHLGN